jgi:hypothetical protein
MFQWRKFERQGALTAVSADKAMVPASELAAAHAEIAKLQRVLGKKNEILREAVDYAAEKKVDCALALAGRGRPVKAVCLAWDLRARTSFACRFAPSRRSTLGGDALRLQAMHLA